MAGPEDPITGVGPVAIALHELFTSLQRAGFSEGHALYLTGKWVEGIARKEA
jgi:hypothetical protein